jgi:hypothetical protein
VIYGEHDLTPEIVTDSLGVKPTYSWKCGDIAQYGAIHKNHGWVFSTDYAEIADFCEFLNPFYDRFFVCQDQIITLTKIYANEIDIELSLIVKIKNMQSPAIYFERNLIEFIQKIKAEIDIDIIT